jgi:hypothetical protein
VLGPFQILAFSLACGSRGAIFIMEQFELTHGAIGIMWGDSNQRILNIGFSLPQSAN